MTTVRICRTCGEPFTKPPGAPAYINECLDCAVTKPTPPPPRATASEREVERFFREKEGSLRDCAACLSATLEAVTATYGHITRQGWFAWSFHVIENRLGQISWIPTQEWFDRWGWRLCGGNPSATYFAMFPKKLEQLHRLEGANR
jgi:hypothetical protein